MPTYYVHWVVDDSFGCARAEIEADSVDAARAKVRNLPLGSVPVPALLADPTLSRVGGSDTIDLHVEVEDVELKPDAHSDES
jgi:hypothetical protein